MEEFIAEKKKRKIVSLFLIISIGMLLCGCKGESTEQTKIKDLEFTVVEDADAPEELLKTIQEKKMEAFQMTYSNEEYLYIAIGYGAQNSGGYSIRVDALYLTQEAICIDTNLLGPSKEDLVTKAETYPYIIIKLEKMDTPVLFY